MGAYYYNQNLCEILGDLNNDSIVNVLDAIIIVNNILDNNAYNICNDINYDNFVNILDIITIINIILNNNYY